MSVNDFSLDFRSLFEFSPGAFIVLLPDLTIAAVTNEYLQLTMQKRENLIGQNIFDIFPDNPNDSSAHSENVRASFLKVFATGEPDELPLQKYDVPRPAELGGGFEERYWRLISFPGFRRNDKIEYIFHRVENITEQIKLRETQIDQEKLNIELAVRAEKSEKQRKAATDALEDAQLRIEVAIAAGEIGTWTWDVPNNRVVADKNLAHFFSVSETDAAGGEIEKYTAAIHPDDRERVEKTISDAMLNQNSYEAEYRLLNADGKIRWVVARGKILRDENGAATQLPGVVIDVTELKNTEKNLRESDERFQLISRATNDAVWDWNLQTDFVWWNDAVMTLFGYKREDVELTAKWWYEHIHPEDRDRIVSGIHEVIDNGGEKWSDEYRFLCADGSFKYIFDRGFAIHRDGKPIRMLGAMLDITRRRETEQALKKSQERLQLVLDSSILGLWYCDLPFDVLNWSVQTKEHFWLPPEATVTIEDFYRIIHPDDREKTRQAIDASIENRTQYDVEYRTVNPHSNQVKWIRAIGRGFYDNNNDPYRFDGITIDISQEKLIESERENILWREKEARSEAEKANRMKDEFLATLSHELRTPLSAILGWSRLLKAGQIKAEQASRAIETIERNAKSQSQLIEDVLDVSRIISGKMRLEVRPIDLASTIEASIDAVRPAAEAKNIRLQRVTDSRVMIAGDADRLQQIIWNLLSNAIKFTPKGGRVQIKTARVNSHVEITVADNGTGIEAETLPYIFERFRQSDSSTTRKYGGLGLGLAIVRHLVELHGGTVQAASDGLDKGAVFTVCFPLIALRSNEISLPKNQNIAVADSTTNDQIPFTCPREIENLKILIVDDEPDTRDVLMFVFETCKAQPKVVDSVETALEIIKKEKFDVLVSDIGMPERDGYELISAVRRLKPEQNGNIPAVALTAYARVEDRLRALSAGFQMHIPKPVEPAELLAVVASLANRKNIL